MKKVEFQRNFNELPKDYQVTRFNKVLYVIPEAYTIYRHISKGSYGKVIICKDDLNSRLVVVKKCEGVLEIDECFVQDYLYLERMYKEIEVLKFFKKNPSNVVIDMIDCYNIKDDVYLVFEYVVNDLRMQLQRHDLHDNFRRVILYKILMSLRLFQKSGIVHRDIKPANILVDGRDYTVKVCDFGLSTNTGSPTSKGTVVTRWYRPIELFLESNEDSQPYIDMWSFGCIMAELYLGQPLFPGKKGYMLCKIFETLGKPDTRKVKFKGCKEAIFWMHNIKSVPYIGTLDKVKDPFVVDLILRCLSYDPDVRITAEEAMRHVLFDNIRRWKDFDEPTSVFRSSFENEWKPKDIRKNLIKMLSN